MFNRNCIVSEKLPLEVFLDISDEVVEDCLDLNGDDLCLVNGL